MDAFTWIVIGLLYLSLICHFPSNFVSNISPTLFGCRFNFLWWFSALRAIRDVRLFFERFPIYFKSHLGEIPFDRNLKMPFGVEAIFPHFQDWRNSLWVACLFFMDVDIRTNFPLTRSFLWWFRPNFRRFFSSYEIIYFCRHQYKIPKCNLIQNSPFSFQFNYFLIFIKFSA